MWGPVSFHLPRARPRIHIALVSDFRPLWTPSTEAIEAANVTRFIRDAVQAHGGHAAEVSDSDSLYEWSVAEPSTFWATFWRFCNVIAEERPGGPPWDAVLEHGERMAPPDPVLGPRWFRGARLNFAENLLRRYADAEALVLWTERGPGRRLTYIQLGDAVARFAGFLRDAGVVAGDRVVGFVPNMPEAVVAMLAAASVGALWSSCSPDFGPGGVLDRFGQIAPKVLVTADGYVWSGKRIDCLERVRTFLPSLPSVEEVVVVPHLPGDLVDADATLPEGALSWTDALALGAGMPLQFTRLPFDHPLYIMYSSGT